MLKKYVAVCSLLQESVKWLFELDQSVDAVSPRSICLKTCMFQSAGDATTTICHRYTPAEQLRVFTQTADILVVATGIPGLITADMVKEGVCVIDVGINRVKDPKTGKFKLVGDVDFEGEFLRFPNSCPIRKFQLACSLW